MSQGKIVQCIGAVIDVEFSRESIPKVYDALVMEGSELTLEVQQQLGDGVVRTIALGSSDGNDVPRGEKGELIYRGPNVMKGYFKKPQANAETLKNGWLYSGDVAIQDEDGFYFIVDRTKDMIIRGGLNVYPREVEEVMIQHEAVSLVAVIGVPDNQMGEEIKACVVLKEGKSITEEELIAWTKNKKDQV